MIEQKYYEIWLGYITCPFRKLIQLNVLFSQATQTIKDLEQTSSGLSALLDKEMKKCNASQLRFFTLAGQ